MRIQNDGAGKSSWWMINPEAKPGKGARRRANSMEQTKNAMDRKTKNRLRNGKKDPQMRQSLPGGNSHLLEPTSSPSSSISEHIDQIPESPAGQMLPNPQQLQQLNPNQLHPHTQSSQNGGSPVYHQLSNLQPQQPPAGQPPMYAPANNAGPMNSNLNNPCMLGQMGSPDHQQPYRGRTTSNASSGGRFSPQEEHHAANNSMNWPPMNPQQIANQAANQNANYQREPCPNEMLNFSNLSINGNNMNDPHHVQHQQNGPLPNTTNYSNDASYMSNNMFIANSPMYADQDPGRGFRKMAGGAVCKTTPPQNSMNNSMNNLNAQTGGLGPINSHQPINCNDSLLNNMGQMDGSLLNSANDNFELMSGGNQSIDSYFAQTDYPGNSGSQLLGESLSCDSNNQTMLSTEANDDENNNRILFGLASLSQPQQSHQQQQQQNAYHQMRYEHRPNGELGR